MTSPDAPPEEAPPPAATALTVTPATAETPPQVDDDAATPEAAAPVGAEPSTDPPAEVTPDSDSAETESLVPAVDVSTAPTAPTAPAAPDLSPAATGARLATLFPALFVGPDGQGTWKAIKLRIHADIQARAPGEFSKRTLGIFFSRYTTTTAYLKALAAPGAQRCDLDGQPAGEIAEEHRSAAAEEVARRQAIVAERRAAARKAQAPRRAAEGVREAGEAPIATPRPPRDPRPPREAGPPRQDADRREGAGRERPMRPPRREPPHQARAHERRDGGASPLGPLGAPRHPSGPVMRDAAAPTTLPLDPAQRERALLLRAFESSPLSKANFCALKRMSEAELDALLAQTRAELGTR